VRSSLAITSTSELLSKLLDIAHGAIVVVDDSFNIQIWNQAAERTFGWTAEEAVGSNVADTMGSGEFAEGMSFEKALDSALRSGSWWGEVVQTRRDGSTFLAEVSFGVLRDADEQVIGYVTNHQNITGQRAVEEELERTVE